MVIAICGGRIFFNFNPLIKLDGYYLLSDAADVPNMQQRARDRVMGHLRWILWGAPRPEREERGGFLLAYGSLSLAYTVTLVTLMLVALSVYSYRRWGLIALVGPAFLGWFVGRSLLQGLFAGEVTRMFTSRPKRWLTWLALLGGVAATSLILDVEREAAGPFTVRPVTRSEIFAPAAGFLQEVPLDEGDRVSPGGLVARLDIPDLGSKLAQKRAEVIELTARVAQVRIELDSARDEYARVDRLFRAGSGSQAEHQESLKKYRTLETELEQCGARLTRANEEVRYLEEVQAKLVVRSPVPGLIMTPRLKEMKGKYFHEGELICVVEEPSVFRAEIKLPEQEVERARAGQRATLKARALPFETFEGVVERIAPGATAPTGTEVQSSIIVYCRLDAENTDLRPAMTGHARIHCGRCSVGRLVIERVLRFLRTEFWW
jgi:putative peptide zinc metalloprotease protein